MKCRHSPSLKKERLGKQPCVAEIRGDLWSLLASRRRNNRTSSLKRRMRAPLAATLAYPPDCETALLCRVSKENHTYYPAITLAEWHSPPSPPSIRWEYFFKAGASVPYIAKCINELLVRCVSESIFLLILFRSLADRLVTYLLAGHFVRKFELTLSARTCLVDGPLC